MEMTTTWIANQQQHGKNDEPEVQELPSPDAMSRSTRKRLVFCSEMLREADRQESKPGSAGTAFTRRVVEVNQEETRVLGRDAERSRQKSKPGSAGTAFTRRDVEVNQEETSALGRDAEVSPEMNAMQSQKTALCSETDREKQTDKQRHRNGWSFVVGYTLRGNNKTMLGSFMGEVGLTKRLKELNCKKHEI